MITAIFGTCGALASSQLHGSLIGLMPAGGGGGGGYATSIISSGISEVSVCRVISPGWPLPDPMTPT